MGVLGWVMMGCGRPEPCAAPRRPKSAVADPVRARACVCAARVGPAAAERAGTDPGAPCWAEPALRPRPALLKGPAAGPTQRIFFKIHLMLLTIIIIFVLLLVKILVKLPLLLLLLLLLLL